MKEEIRTEVGYIIPCQVVTRSQQNVPAIPIVLCMAVLGVIKS